MVGRDWIRTRWEFFVLFGSLGCGPLVGADDFQVDPDLVTPCGPLEVRAGDKCVQVGVSGCADGFDLDNGSCQTPTSTTPCPGQNQLIGSSTCVPIYPCGPSVVENIAGIYVRPGATNGVGSKEQPYGTITEALAKAPVSAPAPLPVQLYAGTYVEPVVITRPVSITGACPDPTHPMSTRIQSPGPGPAMTLTTGADGTRLEGFVVDGGVRIAGANVEVLHHMLLRANNRPALELDDRAGPATGATVTSSVIEDAFGAGILSYGGDLTVRNSTVRRTKPGADPIDTCGICIRASAAVPSGNFWDPRFSSRPRLELYATVVEDNAGSGVSILGADATITGSIIRSTGAAGVPDQNIGVDVQQRPYGDLEAKLTMSRSLVQGVRTIGIRGRNACMSIIDSVVTSIPGRPDARDRRCLGNGIRARWDRPPDDPDQLACEDGSRTLSVTASVIEGTHESGVHLEGGHSEITDSLIRRTEADGCASDFGDGIAAYGYDFSPGTLLVERSRVDDAARHGLVSFASTSVTARESALTAASEPTVFGGDATLDDTFCEWGTGWAPCRITSHPATAALLAPGAEGTVRFAGCYDDASNTQVPLVPNVRFWSPDHDEVPVVNTDSGGCVAGAAPAEDHVMVVTSKPVDLPPMNTLAEGEDRNLYSPTFNRLSTGTHDTPAFLRPGFNTYFVMKLLSDNFFSGLTGFDVFDLTRTTVFAAWACDAGSLTGSPADGNVCRPPHALEGVIASLEDSRAAGPLCTTASGFTTDPGCSADAGVFGAATLWANVPPGEQTVTFTPKDASRRLSCRIGWTSEGGIGEPVAGKANTFRVLLAPGFTAGIWPFCTLE